MFYLLIVIIVKLHRELFSTKMVCRTFDTLTEFYKHILVILFYFIERFDIWVLDKSLRFRIRNAIHNSMKSPLIELM